MFAGSPVKPLQRHIEKVHECVKKLEPFFEAIIKKDYEGFCYTEGDPQIGS